ncbi:hypothetical protein ONS95_010916 [Cadophora gregata]|uniref:uncharacterized protein n=1 Tax=Cadophora gregata TaxID=51156 RepID=UPI0026DB82EB|nr:uncharacterized protein ONS95_010916 [Cadophora gregata]KAK0119468.1 hypothetical protein ONS95_010916 [Cadophora gregata]
MTHSLWYLLSSHRRHFENSISILPSQSRLPSSTRNNQVPHSASNPTKSRNMSFAVGGAAIGFDDFVSPGVSARGIEYGASSYPVLHPRQNSTAPATNDTVNMFIDSMDEDWEYAASIIEACADRTVLALRCTSGGSFVGTQTCGPNAAAATVTVASTSYYLSSAVTTSTLGSQVSATAIESCQLGGTTAATCAVTIGGEVDGKKTSTSTTTTVSGTDYYRFDVAITGGAEKTASATATCAPGKNAGTSLSAKSMMVFGLAGLATSVLALL